MITTTHLPCSYSPRKPAPTTTALRPRASRSTRLASSGVRMVNTFSTSFPLQVRVLGLRFGGISEDLPPWPMSSSLVSGRGRRRLPTYFLVPAAACCTLA